MNDRTVGICGGGLNSHEIFEEIVSLPNLFSAWREFKRGKLKKQDISKFSVDIEEHLFKLHSDLIEGRYAHGGYTHFVICDPKRRDVHKATVRDRVLHHAVFRVLEPVFDRGFIYDSFSSRNGKGIHKAHGRFEDMGWKLSRNNTRTAWVLKCDIRRFFDSVDHSILAGLLTKKLDCKTLELLRGVIASFEKSPGKGIPIGNLTSQLFSNIYMNEFDQFVKRKLRVKRYMRYADDFVVLSTDKYCLEELLPVMRRFLSTKLAIDIHPNKILIRKFNQGIDFLGYVIFPFHKVLRTKTKKRVLKKLTKKQQECEREIISEYSLSQTVQSYMGMLSHCRGNAIKKKIKAILLSVHDRER